MSRRSSILRWITAACMCLAICGVLLWQYPKNPPYLVGDTAEFWHCATGVDVRGDPGRMQSPEMCGFYQPRDEKCIYYYQSLHGQEIHVVPQSQAMEIYPQVLKQLHSTPSDQLKPSVRAALSKCSQQNTPSGAVTLLLEIAEAKHERSKKRFPDHKWPSVAEEEKRMDLFWQRSALYPWRLLFEMVLFCGLALFAAWPWLRQKRAWAWGLHLGLIPLLLFLPLYLGYAPAACTTLSVPGDGVIYPQIVRELGRHGECVSLDIWLIDHCPPLLHPLAQDNTQALSFSGTGCVGPMLLMFIGFMLGSVTASARLAVGEFSNRKKKGPGNPAKDIAVL